MAKREWFRSKVSAMNTGHVRYLNQYGSVGFSHGRIALVVKVNSARQIHSLVSQRKPWSSIFN
jgi:hypothetical protein